MPRPVTNPPNPWESNHVEYIGDPPAAKLQVYEEHARSILSHNDSPDLPFRHSVNPYRGCFHGCCYCYARPTHEYLGFGAGTDFERRIVVKVNAVELLRCEFAKPRWRGEPLAMSGVTDCYQPLEASYNLTRGLLQVCLEHRNPVAIVTKGALIERDIALLAELSKVAGVLVYVSIPFADDTTGRAMEPFAASISRRFDVLARLSAAGIHTGVSVSPMIPGLNDTHMPEILARARQAGASRAFMTMLRLPQNVEPVFIERLTTAFPLRTQRILTGIRSARGGAFSNSQFGKRMSGEGPRWSAIATLFATTTRRLGFVDQDQTVLHTDTFRRPKHQLGLFEDL